MRDRQQIPSASAKPFHASACVAAALLIKLSKHLALIACLMIIGGATGRSAGSQVGIFLTLLTAAFLHSIGRVLQRPPPPARFRRLKP